MITLKTSNVVIDDASTQNLRREFQQRHCALLQGLLDASLLGLLRPRLANDDAWVTFEHEGIGREVVLRDDYALTLLHFATNAPIFLDAMRRVTGCDAIARFQGRVFRMSPSPDHFDSWHDDVIDGRLVGMSVNLSFDGYEGGEFELRDRDSECQLARIATRVAGNASLFRIDSRLQHRVAPLVGDRSRTAFAGWFKSGQPDAVTRLSAPPGNVGRGD